MIQEIAFEGCVLVVDKDAKLQLGDTYLAQRNGESKLLTCKEVSTIYGYVVSVEKACCYDIPECIKVLEIKEQ
jgi:hypothetical protein